MLYGDNPISRIEQDSIDRKGAVETLTHLLLNPNLETPIVVGVNGEWGSGKTSVMKMVCERLPSYAPKVWFDAWRYSRQDTELWRALLLAVVEEMRSFPPPEPPPDWAQRLDRLVTSLYRAEQYEVRGGVRMNWEAAVPLVLQAVLGFVPGSSETWKFLKEWFRDEKNPEKLVDLVERERVTKFREQVQSLEQFRAAMTNLTVDYLSRCGARAGTGKDGLPLPTRMYIFIDDLDRCLPEATVGVLEAVKLFLDITGCVFVLGIDRAAVDRAIRIRYKDTVGLGEPIAEARNYLDKIVQVPFQLPALDESQIRQLVTAWCKANRVEDQIPVLSDVIASGVAPNPRSVKRTLNISRLMVELRAAHRQGVDSSDSRLLTKLVVLQNSYPAVYERVLADSGFLKRLEAAAAKEGGSGSEVDFLTHHPRLRAMLRTESRFDVLAPDRLRDLIYLTRVSAYAAQPSEALPATTPR